MPACEATTLQEYVINVGDALGELGTQLIAPGTPLSEILHVPVPVVEGVAPFETGETFADTTNVEPSAVVVTLGVTTIVGAARPMTIGAVEATGPIVK